MTLPSTTLEPRDAGARLAACLARNERRHAARALDPFQQRVANGLRAGEFELAFQGIYHARSESLASVEALIRWLHPEYGLLMPASFLGALEHPRVAADLTYFVIDRACRALAVAAREGRATVPVALNVPPSVAALPDFAFDTVQIAAGYGVAPALLEIELSESEDAAKLLSSAYMNRTWRRAGLRIAMDDFGTGYSSLALLSRFDIDTVKLAKELLAGVPACPRASTVVSRVLGMLAALDVRVVVEGVETAEQARWLAQFPGVLVQGFYYCRPGLGLESVPEIRPRAVPFASGWR